MAELIDPADPLDPIARQFVPDARELEQSPQESRDPIGDDAFSPVEGIVHRYPDRVLLKIVQRLRGLLPVLLPPRNGGAGEGRIVAGRARGRARLHPCSSGNLGSDFERRRSARAFGAADQGSGRLTCRYRSRQGDPGAYPRAGGRAGTDLSRPSPRAASAGQGNLRCLARQSSPRIDQTGPRCLRALYRRRHSDAVPVGAVARRKRRNRDARRADAYAWSSAVSSPITCIMPILRPARRICAQPLPRVRR